MKTRLSSIEAGKYLGFAEATMRESRVTGRLAGVDAPTYQKIGSRVFYDQDVLDTWLAQFPQARHTAAHAVGGLARASTTGGTP